MNEHPGRLPWFKRIFFVSVTFLLVLLGAELALQVLSSSVDAIYFRLARTKPVHFADNGRILPNPRHPGHDREGFRNNEIPDRTEFVFMGDSQVYGVSVQPEENFSRVLESNCKVSVHNLALPGYSAPYNLLHATRAIELDPERLFLSIYAGNDMNDAYLAVYEHGLYPNLRSDDEKTLSEIQELESKTPLTEKIAKVMRLRGEETDDHGPVRDWFSHNSRLYGLLRSLKSWIRRQTAGPIDPIADWEADKKAAMEGITDSFPYEKGGVRTVLTPLYRSYAQDLSDPRNAEGLRIIQDCLEIVRQRTNDEDIELTLLLIPTKEFVFAESYRENYPEVPAAYTRLLKTESEIWAEMKSFLEDRGIVYLDMATPLKKALEEGIPPYLESWDGHPSPEGHEAIARAIAEYLELDCEW
jgi:hypothetical protein